MKDRKIINFYLHQIFPLLISEIIMDYLSLWEWNTLVNNLNQEYHQQWNYYLINDLHIHSQVQFTLAIRKKHGVKFLPSYGIMTRCLYHSCHLEDAHQIYKCEYEKRTIKNFHPRNKAYLIEETNTPLPNRYFYSIAYPDLHFKSNY